MGLDNSFLKHRFNAKRILIGLTDELTCYCDDTSSNQLGSRGCVSGACYEGEETCREGCIAPLFTQYQIKNNVYELLFSILI